MRRIEISRVAVGAALSLLAIAYWFVQIARGDYYFSLSENNRIRSVKVTAPRGYVLDRNGAVLVENEPAYTLQLYRREARDLDASVDFIVNLLGLDRVAGDVPRRARHAARPSSSRSRSPRTSASRRSRRSRPARSTIRSSRSRCRSGGSTSTAARPRTPSDTSPKRRPSRSRDPRASTRSATGSARRGSRAPTSGCSRAPTASGA